jgi:hypothetical protein
VTPACAWPSAATATSSSNKIGYSRAVVDGDRSTSHDDQAAQPAAVDAVAGAAHDGHDLLDRRWIRRVAHPLVARRPAGVEFRQRGG